jgi:hypothetical protein
VADGSSSYRFPVSLVVIGALALQTLRQCVRSKVLFVLALFVLALVVGSAVIPSHEPLGRFSAIISLTLTLVSFFGVLVAVFLAATVLPEDRAKKTISTLMTKPVGKLNYLLGRVAGFAATLGIILAVMGVAGWGFIRWAGASAERRTGRTDLLVGKRGIEPVEVLLRDGAQTLKLSDTADAARLDGPERRELVYAFRKGGASLPSGNQHLDLLPSVLTTGAFQRVDGRVTVENPKTRESKRFDVLLDSDRLTVVNFPGDLVDPDEGVVVTLSRADSLARVYFKRGDFQLMLPSAPFEWAYAKSLAMTFLAFLLVIVVSVAASTFLSQWVAVLLAFTAWFFALFQEVIVDFMQSMHSEHAGFLGARLFQHVHGPVEETPDPWIILALNKVFAGGMWVLTHIFPDFQRFDATAFLTASRDVPAAAVGMSALVVAAYGSCYLALGLLIFHRREMMP